jgi:hypothetical protein
LRCWLRVPPRSAWNRDSEIPTNGLDMKTAAIRAHALAKSLGVEKARVVGHWKDFAADKFRSLSEAERAAYTAAYARSGRMRAGWAYFVSFPQAAKDFAGLAETKLDDAGLGDWRREGKRTIARPTDEGSGYRRHHGRPQRYWALGPGRTSEGND